MPSRCHCRRIYTVDIPYPHRVEQLPYAKLALQGQVHTCPVCREPHRDWAQDVARGLAQQAVLHWTKCICTQPYNVHGGVLHPTSANVWTSSLFKR
jgi:hypothetical protein